VQIFWNGADTEQLDGSDLIGEAQYATLRDLAGCRRRDHPV